MSIEFRLPAVKIFAKEKIGNMYIAVIGAGPAGLLAATEAAKAGANVTLFDKNEKAGKKLYITGKGRCNVTNMRSPGEFLEFVVRNRKFLYGAIYSFSPENTVELIESNGVKTKVERGNRVFPQSDKASDITKALVKNAERYGVKFSYNSEISDVSKVNDMFFITSRSGKERFDKVIVACGGMSYPSTGSTGDGYAFAKKFGHKIVELRPALVGLTLKESVKALQGLSLRNVTATIDGGGVNETRFGEMLFTSSGVSGPIILSLSSFVNRVGNVKDMTLSIDLKPAMSAEELDKRVLSDFNKNINKRFKNSLDELLPKSLIPYIIGVTGISPEKPLNSVTKEDRAKIVETLKNLKFGVAALGSLNEAVVTSGGVSVSEVNPKTMESKLVHGLYFAGEVLDVDALTGGFNIQIALSTGFVAGKSAGQGA